MQAKRLPVPKTHALWLEQRRHGLTATDIPALFGQTNYKSPMSIYLDKVNPPRLEDLHAKTEMRLGNHLEEPIAQFYKLLHPEITFRKIQTTLVHPKYEWARCNIDRHIIKPKESLLECKLVGIQKKSEWGEEDVPDEYFTQVQWQMFVTGIKTVNFAALAGGTSFAERVVEYDPEIGEMMFEKARDFWENYVKKGVPPAIDGSDATTQMINRIYSEGNVQAAREAAQKFLGDKSVSLAYEADKMIVEYAKASPTINAMKEKRDLLGQAFFDHHIRLTDEILALLEKKNAIANELRMRLNVFDEAYVEGGGKVTWKAQSRKSIDSTRLKAEAPAVYEAYQKESVSRVLRVTPKKGAK